MLSLWPEVSHEESDFWKVLEAAKAEGTGLGIDTEFGAQGITVLGVASQKLIYAGPWNETLALACVDSDLDLVAYAGVSADRPELEEALGIKIPLNRIQDGLLRMFLCYPGFAAAPGKEEDSEDAGALGYFNLWACTSLICDVPNWKRCRGAKCSGPCPSFRKESNCPVPAWEGELIYCGLDAWAGLIANIELKKKMERLQIPEATYERLRRLAEYCYLMQRKGLKVNMAYVAELEEKVRKKKLDLFPFEENWLGKKGQRLKKPKKVYTNAPFNPNSPKAVVSYFEAHGISLRDRGGKPSKGKSVVIKALQKVLKKYDADYDPKEANVIFRNDAEPPEDGFPEPVELLLRLAQLSASGKGFSSWFDAKYITNEFLAPDTGEHTGELHPRFNVIGASTGRLSSSSPNATNFPRVGFGAEIRRAIIPMGPDYGVLKGDYSQGEFRACLWYAKSAIPADGAFEWMVEDAGELYTRAAAFASWKPRDVAKSIVHATDYLEGLVILSKDDLNTARRKKERAVGALTVYDGTDGRPLWTYHNGIVCFTGGNLSERLFGDKTFENRKIALDMRERFLSRFHHILEWQIKLAVETESYGLVRSASGKVLQLPGDREDALKLVAAFKGQNALAEYCQEAMLRFGDLGHIASAQIHDEILFTDIPNSWADEQALEFMKPMCVESEVLPGFWCPVEVKRGSNWKDTTVLGKLTL